MVRSKIRKPDEPKRVNTERMKQALGATKDPKINEYFNIEKKYDNVFKSFEYYRENETNTQVKKWIAEELDKWSQRHTAIVFFDFLDEYGIPENLFYEWSRSHPGIKTSHALAIQRIGSRRLKLAAFKGAECNERFIYNTLRVYSKEHRECYDEEIKNKTNLDKEHEKVTVIIKDFNSSKDKTNE